MTDSSILLPNTQSLPSDCLFNLKPSSMRARQLRCSVPSSNKSSFNAGDSCVFYIPSRRNCYLDCSNSYLRYTVANNDTGATCTFDNNGACVINRLDAFSGSNLIDSIISYNQLYTYILDVQTNAASSAGLSSMWGTAPVITDQRKGAVIAASGRATICMPLLGVLGIGSDKFLPLSALSDDIRIELTLESNLIGMVWSAAPASATPYWSIINMQLELTIVEVSDEAESYIRSVTPFDKPIYLHSNSWRHYASTLPSITGNYSTLVPIRFASTKSIVLCPRRSVEISSATSYSLSSRANPQISSYFFRIGSSLIPNRAVDLDNVNTTGNYSEAFSELIRSWHSLSNTYISTVLNRDYYNVGDIALANTNITAINTVGNSYKNGFVIACEMESYSNKNDVLLSGYNTLGSQTFFECNLNATGPANSYTLDFFANFDVILVLENGLLSARY